MQKESLFTMKPFQNLDTTSKAKANIQRETDEK
jgi:hypothetical protein